MKSDDLAQRLLNHPDHLAALRTLYPDGVHVYADPWDGRLIPHRRGDIPKAGAVWVDADKPKPVKTSYVNVYLGNHRASAGLGYPTIEEADRACRGSESRIGLLAVSDDGLEIVWGAR